jgi:hypothetical protein
MIILLLNFYNIIISIFYNLNYNNNFFLFINLNIFHIKGF